MADKHSLNDFIDAVFVVLKSADTETDVLNTQIPSEFHEDEPSNVVGALSEYLETSSEFKSTSVLDRYQSNSYKQVYDIYHDITVACSISITKFKIGSQKYKNVDFFYKFASEVLLREAGLFHLSLTSDKEEEETTELAESIESDFDKIGYSYMASNGEILSYMAEVPNPKVSSLSSSYGFNGAAPQLPATITQPVFTSSLGKSGLDPRLTLIPEPYNLSKSIALPRNVGSSSNTFESLNTITPKIPLPTNKPTTMMDKFLYINWYIIPSPAWLTYKARKLKPTVTSTLFKSGSDKPFRYVEEEDESVRSFAPTIDSKGKGVSEALKTSIWFNQIGESKIKEIRDEYFKNIGKEAEKKTKTQDKPKEDEEEEEEDVEPYTPEPPKDIEPYESSKSVDVENVVKWDPAEHEELIFLKKHKEDIQSPKKIQALISQQILNLNKLRQQRFVKSNVANLLPASPEEKAIYNRIVKLFSIVISVYKLSPKQIPLEFSGKIPVLMTDYSGTLPALPVTKTKPAAARIPTIRGPYKKKRL